MAGGIPRNARHVDPASRQMAEDLARRSGLSLNEWVARLMAEGPEDATSQDYFSQSASANYVEAPRAEAQPRYEAVDHPADEVARVTQALERLSHRIESAENRQALAIAGIERSVRDVIGRIDAGEREHMHVATRVDAAESERQQVAAMIEAAEADRQRVAARVEAAEAERQDVAARVEAAEAERLAVAARLEAAEREQVQVAARFEGALQEAQRETEALEQRLSKIEGEAVGPQTTETLHALEGAIGQVATHVYEGDKRSREMLAELRSRLERLEVADKATVGAMRELKNSCSALDQRLSLAERGAADGVERAAAQLSARVEESREDLARQLSAAADARFDRVDQALSQMSEHVRAAEQRSAGAIERMGHEVLEVAQTLNRRVQAAERQNNEAVERVSSDVSRIAGAVEDRLARADSLQAKALEKLGGEIARITERLADRIANSERRSAQAIDDVGEQITRVAERLTQRGDRTSSELADRIRQSEERTAKLLEEARAKLEERLAETQRRIAETAPRVAEAPDEPPFDEAPFPGFETSAERPFAAVAATAPTMETLRGPPTPFDEEDFAAASSFAAAPADELFETPAPAPATAPIAPAAASTLFDDDLADVELEPNVGFDVDDDLLLPPAPTRPTAPLSDFPPRQPAPPAAPPPKAAEDPLAAPGAFSLPLPPAETPQAGAPLTTREVIERARAAARAGSERDGLAKLRAAAKPGEDSVLQGLSFGRSRRRPGGTTGALMVASLLAAVGLSAGGYYIFEGKPGGKLPRRMADALSVVTGGTPTASDAAAEPMAAMALAPKPDAAPGPDLSQAFDSARNRIATSPAIGLADIRKLADGGYAPAEFYLGQLYQEGKAGLKKDPAQARGWLERAAEGGDRTAMHNLALDEHEGVGGPRNSAAAAEWFRRAAELGLVDSQFNLAAIYEHGDGVSQNPAEAYKWYLIASRAGDAESKAGALRVRAGLSADARSVAERAAAEFQPSTPSPAAAVQPMALAAPVAAVPLAPASPDLVTAQRALNQLGYYQGPTDGVASQALHMAIAAYQRDQSLPVTGATDPATLAKLSVYTR
jgi:localization factor PodJL